MKTKLLAWAFVWMGCVAISTEQPQALGADHRDAPAFTTGIAVGAPSPLDLNDIYVFQSPENSRNTVLILTVNPLTAPGNNFPFSSTGLYEFKIDLNGDALEDLTYSFQFQRVVRGQQVYSVTETRGGRSKVLTRTAKSGTTTKLAGGAKVTAGLFDDPFFFDFQGFVNAFNPATGNDFFGGSNISAIVLEVPSSVFGAQRIGVWARTLNDQEVQVDRTGLPAINPVFTPPTPFFNGMSNPPYTGMSLKNLFNASHPSNDVEDFFESAVQAILPLNGNRAYSEAVVGVVLPDIMPFNTKSTEGFLNGRRLADDVIDAELSIVTNGGLNSDGVDANDVPFRTRFPYLGLPQQQP